jgi:hypothetical protein
LQIFAKIFRDSRFDPAAPPPERLKRACHAEAQRRKAHEPGRTPAFQAVRSGAGRQHSGVDRFVNARYEHFRAESALV